MPPQQVPPFGSWFASSMKSGSGYGASRSRTIQWRPSPRSLRAAAAVIGIRAAARNRTCRALLDRNQGTSPPFHNFDADRAPSATWLHVSAADVQYDQASDLHRRFAATATHRRSSRIRSDGGNSSLARNLHSQLASGTFSRSSRGLPAARSTTSARNRSRSRLRGRAAGEAGGP